MCTIKRHLKKLNLFRRPVERIRTDDATLMAAVKEELSGSGSYIGYMRVWAHLRKTGLEVRQDDVSRAILQYDPDGVSRRQRRKLRRRKYFIAGPNYFWHIDGHDKLKLFGFSLHGCIDGFSRRLIWLEVSSSNKKPEIIGKFYLDAVRQLQSIPKKLKADDGTEHAIIQPIHILLRDAVGDNNSVNSFSIVPSTHNQRIEAYWSKLRQDRIGWWQDFFRDMVDLELFNPASRVLVDCLKFCFIGVLRKELKEMAEEWNEHIISKSSNGGPSGRPDTMYFLPHLFDCQDYSDPLEDDDMRDFTRLFSGVR